MKSDKEKLRKFKAISKYLNITAIAKDANMNSGQLWRWVNGLTRKDKTKEIVEILERLRVI